MPTSKARKRRIIATQKRKQKDALSTKTRLGLNIQAKSLKKNSAVRSAIAAIVEGMKNVVKSPAKVSAKSDLTKLNENCIVDTNQRQTNFQFGNHDNMENDNDIQDHYSHETGAAGRLRKQRMKAVSAKLTVSSNAEEFAKLKDRVGNAEREIQELKQLVQKCENCKKCEHGMTNRNTTYPALNEKEIKSSQYTLPPVIGPPPPPAPPPPPLPVVKDGPRSALKIKRSDQQGKLTKNRNKTGSLKSMQITADQILKVKLKRVSHNQQENIGNHEKERQLVTLGDLQTVKLRKRPFGDASTPLTDLSNNFQNSIDKRLKFSIEKKTPLTKYNLRKTLKKVDMLRSPGGTPLVKSKLQCGQGVTPLLTEALRRKFQNVNPPSSENSPTFYKD